MEMGNNLIKYIVYITINLKNQKFYIGVHKTENPFEFDGYLGCGAFINKPSSYNKGKTLFHRAILKYGVNSFKRITLFIYNTEKEALQKEAEIVTEEFIKRKDVYNLIPGGKIPPIHCKQIYVFDLNGNLLNTYNSITECTNKLNLGHDTITACILREKAYKEYIFSYSNCINPKNYKMNATNGIYQYNKEGLLLKKYKNIQEMADGLDLPKQECIRIINERVLKYECYFLYANEDINDFLNEKSNKLFVQKRNCYCYTLDKKFYKTFQSLGAASHFCKVTYSTMLRHMKLNTPCNNYYWSYIKADVLPEINYYKKDPVKIAQYDKDHNLIKIWDSITDCKKEFPSCLKVCRKERRVCKGYIFEYIS